MKVFTLLFFFTFSSFYTLAETSLPGVTSVTRKDWYTFPYDLSSLVFTFSYLGCGNSEFSMEATPSLVDTETSEIKEVSVSIIRTTSFQCTMPNWQVKELTVATKEINQQLSEKFSNLILSRKVSYRIANPFTLIN